jgi:hypothetical protein
MSGWIFTAWRLSAFAGINMVTGKRESRLAGIAAGTGLFALVVIPAAALIFFRAPADRGQTPPREQTQVAIQAAPPVINHAAERTRPEPRAEDAAWFGYGPLSLALVTAQGRVPGAFRYQEMPQNPPAWSNPSEEHPCGGPRVMSAPKEFLRLGESSAAECFAIAGTNRLRMVIETGPRAALPPEALPAAVDGLRGPVSRFSLMIADEVVAELAAGADAQQIADEMGWTVRWRMPGQPVFVFGLPASIRPEAAAAWLKSKPLILSATPNRVYLPTALPNDPLIVNQYYLNNTGQTGGTAGADIHAARAWDITRGSKSVIVADVDTGMHFLHLDIAANIYVNPREVAGNGVDDDNNGYIDDVSGYDFTQNKGGPWLPRTYPQWHGTYTSSIIGSPGNNDIGVSGVAQLVSILPIRVFDDAWISTEVKIAAGADYARIMRARVMNCSFGGYEPSTIMDAAFTRAANANVLIVCAAGNDNKNMDATGNLFYPAASDIPGLISVGGSDHNDQRWGGSNYGILHVDIFAAGWMVYAASNVATSTGLSNYWAGDGTSGAAPQVSGAAALLLAKRPGLTVTQLKHMILSSADPVSALDGLCVTGSRLNVAAALVADPGPASDDAFEDNNTQARATSIVIPAAFDHLQCNDADWFRADITQDGTFGAQVNWNALKGGPLLIAAIDASGKVLAQATDSSHAAVAVPVVSGTSIWVRVTYLKTKLSDYSLAAGMVDAREVDDTWEQAKPIAAGATENDTIWPASEADWRTFYLSYPQVVTVTVTGPAAARADLRLFRKPVDTNLIARAKGNGVKASCMVLVQPGRYYTYVSSPDAGAYQINLKIEPALSGVGMRMLGKAMGLPVDEEP